VSKLRSARTAVLDARVIGNAEFHRLPVCFDKFQNTQSMNATAKPTSNTNK
jgi:hypothetical protein